MRWLAVGVAIAVVAVLGRPAAAPALELGVSDDGVTRGLIGPQRHAAALGQLGADLHRLTFNWRFAEPRPGDYRFGIYDAIYASDLQRGVRPVFIVLFAPDWTWDPGIVCARDRTCPYPPSRAHLGAWASLIDQLVRRYPRMAALEVWNEPNVPAFWGPHPDPGRYVELVRAARDAVRAAGSSVPVLAGSLSNAPSAAGVPGIDAAPFLAAMFAQGAAGTYDGLSLHPYPRGLDLSSTFRALSLVTHLRRRFGDVTPLWVTEFGATTVGGESEAGQAAVLVRVLRILAARPEVRAAFIHTLVAPDAGLANPESGYGILRSDLTPKLSYCAVAFLRLRLAPDCPGPSPLTAPDPRLEARWDAQEPVALAVDAALRAGGLARFSNPDPRRVSVVRLQGAPAATTLCSRSSSDRSYCATLTGAGISYGHVSGLVRRGAALDLARIRPGW